MPAPLTEVNMPDVAIVDVDGTLIDTNYQHAPSWFRAFRRCGITVPVWHLHRAIGMGGDRLVTHVAGRDTERCHGDQLREAHADEFDAWIGQVCAFADAASLLDHLPTSEHRDLTRRRAAVLAAGQSATLPRGYDDEPIGSPRRLGRCQR